MKCKDEILSPIPERWIGKKVSFAHEVQIQTFQLEGTNDDIDENVSVDKEQLNYEANPEQYKVFEKWRWEQTSVPE